MTTLLVDLGRGGALRRDLDLHRVPQHASGELRDLGRHGGREEQRSGAAAAIALAMRPTSLMKPMSSMRSASSSTSQRRLATD